jgi:hypothetical protein
VDSNSGRAYVYGGGASGLGRTPLATLTGPDGPNGYFGISVASAGDENGDGYSDLVLGAYGAPRGGSAYVYTGGAAGLVATPAVGLAGSDPAGNFGISVFGASD